MAFDIDGAKKAGYSDNEIAQHLAQQNNFDYDGAVKSGYSPQEILQHLSASDQPSTASRIGHNAISDVKNLATSVPGLLQTGLNVANMPMDLLKAPVEYLTHQPSSLKRDAESAKSILGAIPSTVQNVAHEVMHPVDSFIEHPVNTALDAASVVAPAFKGLRALGGAEGVIGAPVVPAERAAAVQAAKDLGVPLTRAEMTGSMVPATLESLFEKSLTGSQPFHDFHAKQAEAINKALQDAQARFGTSEPSGVVGMKAKQALAEQMAQAQAHKNELFSQVPDNVHIPLNEAQKTADQIIQEQSQFLPTTRNADISAVARDIQSTSKRPTPTESVEPQGYTYNQPDKVTPAPSDAFGSWGMDERKPGDVTHSIQYNVRNETPQAPLSNYEQLKRLRENLTGRINAAQMAGNDQTARDFIRMKQAVDNDINSYVESPKSPLEDMVGDEFARSYKQANAASKDFGDLYKRDQLVNRIQDAKPEDVTGAVLGKGRLSDALTAKKAMGDQGFDALRQQFFSDIANSKSINTTLSKYEPSFLQEVLKPEELAALQKIGGVKNIAYSAEKLAGNASGTGRIAMGGAHAGGLVYALLHGNIPAAAAILGVPYVGAKALLSDAATQGLKYHLPYAAAAPAVIPTLQDALLRASKNQE